MLEVKKRAKMDEQKNVATRLVLLADELVVISKRFKALKLKIKQVKNPYEKEIKEEFLRISKRILEVGEEVVSLNLLIENPFDKNRFDGLKNKAEKLFVGNGKSFAAVVKAVKQ